MGSAGQSKSGRRKTSQIVAFHVPRQGNDSSNPSEDADRFENVEFENAFFKTLLGEGEGLITPFLFHDLTADASGRYSDGTYHSLKRRFGRMLHGASGWDEHIKTATDYSFPEGDINAIRYAVKKGMLDKLPEKLKLIEYGSGGWTGVVKPTELIRAIMNHGRSQVSSYVGIDRLSRYATESTQAIHDEFNIHSYAVVADFMAKSRITIPNGKDSVPVVAAFGGPFANAPDCSKSGGQDSIKTAATYFSQMNKQHGLGSYALISFNAEHDGAKLAKQYKKTDAFEGFLLTAFTLAVEQNLITDKNYDVFENWEMEPVYVADKTRESLDAVCRKDHTIETSRGPVSFLKGQHLSFILSHQWAWKVYAKQILKPSGYEGIVYQEPGQSRGIILAKAVRSPA